MGVNDLLQFSSSISADFEQQKLANMAGSSDEINTLVKLVQESRREVARLSTVTDMLLKQSLESACTINDLNELLRERAARSPSRTHASPSMTPALPSTGRSSRVGGRAGGAAEVGACEERGHR